MLLSLTKKSTKVISSS